MCRNFTKCEGGQGHITMWYIRPCNELNTVTELWIRCKLYTHFHMEVSTDAVNKNEGPGPFAPLATLPSHTHNKFLTPDTIRLCTIWTLPLHGTFYEIFIFYSHPMEAERSTVHRWSGAHYQMSWWLLGDVAQATLAGLSTPDVAFWPPQDHLPLDLSGKSCYGMHTSQSHRVKD